MFRVVRDCRGYDRIGDREDLTGQGDQGDLTRLAVRKESLIERGEGRRRAQRYPSASRPCGASRSMCGPRGTTCVGLMSSWVT